MNKRSPRMSTLVVAALRNLRDVHGSTAKDIMKYIMAEYNGTESTIQRQLKSALKRGLDYGILKRTPNGYCLNMDSDIDVQPQDEGCGMKCFKPKKRKKAGCKKKRKKRRKKKAKRAACPRKRKKKKSAGKCKKVMIKKKSPKSPGKLCTICATRDPRANGGDQFCDHTGHDNMPYLEDSEKFGYRDDATL